MDNNGKIEVILAQWQTCVEMANSISHRRDTMNNLFVTLNLALVAAVSLIWNVKSILILISGIVICILWIFFIRNYKVLNSEKFAVINEIERSLPCKPFSKEWERLKKNKKYRDGTTLEKVLPMLFIVLYVISAFIIIFTHFLCKGV